LNAQPLPAVVATGNVKRYLVRGRHCNGGPLIAAAQQEMKLIDAARGGSGYVLLLKTKKPAVEPYYAYRTLGDRKRFLKKVTEVDKSIRSGGFMLEPWGSERPDRVEKRELSLLLFA